MSTYAKAKYTKAYISCLAVDFNLNYLLKDDMLDRGGNNSRKMVFAILHNRMGIDRDVIKMFISSKKLIVNQRFDLCFLEHEQDVIVASTNKLHNYERVANVRYLLGYHRSRLGNLSRTLPYEAVYGNERNRLGA